MSLAVFRNNWNANGSQTFLVRKAAYILVWKAVLFWWKVSLSVQKKKWCSGSKACLHLLRDLWQAIKERRLLLGVVQKPRLWRWGQTRRKAEGGWASCQKEAGKGPSWVSPCPRGSCSHGRRFHIPRTLPPSVRRQEKEETATVLNGLLCARHVLHAWQFI